MMGSETKVALLLTLMRQLQEVMRTENALLREMKLARLQELQADKSAIAASYEIELRRLRQVPETFAALDPEARSLLETTMREFQRTVQANAERLQQSQRIVEGVVQVIGQSLGTAASVPRAYGSRPQVVAEPGPVRVIPVAFDRRC